MAVISTLSIQMNLDTSGFNRSMDAVGRKLEETGSRLRGIGTTLSTYVTAPIVGGFGAAVFAASDLNETMNKTGVVFGDAADGVVAWSQDSATAFGMSQNEALGYASTLGNIFTSMGMAGDEAASLSTDIVALGADLGSFNNVPTADALEAIRAGLLGEYEPLRRFGIVLDDASVKAKAMEMGLADANGEVSAQNMVLARQALITEGAANAQGDFAETSGSLANQMKILRARLTNAAAAIGQILLPYVTRLVGFVSKLIERFDGLSQRTKVITVIVGLFAASIGPVLLAIGTLLPVISKVLLAGGKLIQLFKAIRIAMLSSLGPILLIVAAVAAIYFIWTRDLFGIKSKITAWFDTFRDTGIDRLRARFEKFRQTLNNLYKMNIWKVRAAFDDLQEKIGRMWSRVKGPLTQFASLVGTKIVDAVQWMVDNLYRLDPLIARLSAVFSGFVALVTALVNGDWSGAWDAFKGIVENAALAALEAFRLAWDAIKGIFSRIDWNAIASGIGSVGSYIWSHLGDVGAVLWQWLKDGAGWVAGQVSTLWDEYKDDLAAIGTYLVTHIDDVGATLWGWLQDGVGWVAGKLSTFWDDHKDEIALLARDFVLRMKAAGPILWDWLKTGGKYVAGLLGVFWDRYGDDIKKLPGKFVDLMTGLGGKLWDWSKAGAKYLAGQVGNLWAEHSATIKSLPGKFISLMGGLGSQLWSWAKQGAGYVGALAVNIWNDVKPKLQAIPGKLVEGIGSLGGQLYEWVKTGAADAATSVAANGSAALTSMKNIGTSLGSAIKNAFNNALSGIGSWLISHLNGIIDDINGWIKSANDKIPFGNPIPYIPRIGGGGSSNNGGGQVGVKSIGGEVTGAQVINATITINVNGVDSPKSVAQEVYSTFARELGLKGAV